MDIFFCGICTRMKKLPNGEFFCLPIGKSQNDLSAEEISKRKVRNNDHPHKDFCAYYWAWAANIRKEISFAKCKKCKKEIFWIKTLKNANMPVDAETYVEGQQLFMRGNNTSHFQTCPVKYKKGQ